jgi:hypothetical protein
LPKIPVFPIYSELHCPQVEQNVADFCPLRNHQKSTALLPNSERYLSNVTAKINDSHSAHEISLFFTFTLFCALPRTINPYDFRLWYPKGICSFVAAGANYYVVTFDEKTVLKFPVVPQEEQIKHRDPNQASLGLLISFPTPP